MSENRLLASLERAHDPLYQFVTAYIAYGFLGASRPGSDQVRQWPETEDALIGRIEKSVVTELEDLSQVAEIVEGRGQKHLLAGFITEQSVKYAGSELSDQYLGALRSLADDICEIVKAELVTKGLSFDTNQRILPCPFIDDGSLVRVDRGRREEIFANARLEAILADLRAALHLTADTRIITDTGVIWRYARGLEHVPQSLSALSRLADFMAQQIQYYSDVVCGYYHIEPAVKLDCLDACRFVCCSLACSHDYFTAKNPGRVFEGSFRADEIRCGITDEDNYQLTWTDACYHQPITQTQVVYDILGELEALRVSEKDDMSDRLRRVYLVPTAEIQKMQEDLKTLAEKETELSRGLRETRKRMVELRRRLATSVDYLSSAMECDNLIMEKRR